MIGHPSKRKLQSWLDDEHAPAIDAHLATCERCASHLEGISEAHSDGSIAASLHHVLAPPPDLTATIETRVVEKLDSRQVLGYMADLFGAGIETSKLFLIDDPVEE